MINNAENIDIIHRAMPINATYNPVEASTEENTKNNNRTESDYYKDVLSISDDYYELQKSKTNIENKDNTEKLEHGQESIKSPSGKELEKTDKQVVKELEKRDQEVRSHEEAHKAAGGGLVKGGASYNYTVGPDGKQYAIGGEVKIDMSPIQGDPNATIKKMQQVKKAALAPSDPSTQDLSVAQAAAKIETEAKSELAKSKDTKTISKNGKHE